MDPADPKTPAPQTYRYIFIVGFSLAAVIAVLLTIIQFYSITQLLIRLPLIVAVYFLAATLHRKFPPPPRSTTVTSNPAPLSLRTVFAMCTPMLWFVANFIVLFYGIGGSQLISAIIWQLPMMIGFMVLGAGYMRRIGDSRHCPNCEYPYTFDSESSTDSLTRCPECGTDWLGKLKTGRKKRSLKNVFIGIAIIFFAIVILNPIFYISWLARYLPTPLLYTSSYLTPSIAHNAWDELASRKLSPFWTSLMAKRVIGLREHKPTETSSRWFEAIASTGAIPQELVDEFHDRGFRADLFLPDHIKANEPFTAALRVSHANFGSTESGGILFAGYYLDDNKTPLGRLDETQWTFKLNPEFLKPYRDCFEQPITITKKGDTTIRVVYWLVYQPQLRDQLKWLPDGTPAPIPGVLWSRRYEFSKTIRVE